MTEITSAERRELKGRAQRLEPLVYVGRQGLSEALFASVEAAFLHHDLIKVKFVEFKEERKELAAALAEKTGSALVTVVGHVAVLFRRLPAK